MTEKIGLNYRGFMLDMQPNNVSEWDDVENLQRDGWMVTEEAEELIFLL